MLRIPLLLADVACLKVAQEPQISRFLLGLLPSGEPRRAWIFHLGPCSQQELQDELWRLGRHGALRRDSYVLGLTEQLLGCGASGKVVLAKMRTATAFRWSFSIPAAPRFVCFSRRFQALSLVFLFFFKECS